MHHVGVVNPSLRSRAGPAQPAEPVDGSVGRGRWGCCGRSGCAPCPGPWPCRRARVL